MKMLGPGDSQGSRRTGEGNRIYLKVKGKSESQSLKRTSRELLDH